MILTPGLSPIDLTLTPDPCRVTLPCCYAACHTIRTHANRSPPPLMLLGPPGSNSVNASTAALLVTDYGKALGPMHAVAGTAQHVYERKYEKATVRLDCNTFTGTFEEQ